MYFNKHLRLHIQLTVKHWSMYTTKRHILVVFIWWTLLLSKSAPSLQFHDLRSGWHSQKKAVRCIFLPCLAKQQRKVPTDPVQCRVMQWCTTQCTGFCKLRRFTAMSATWCISCAPFFRHHPQPSTFYWRSSHWCQLCRFWMRQWGRLCGTQFNWQKR